MYSNIEAQVVLSKCKKEKKTYGVRMEKTPLGWKYNWAFTLSENRAKRENYSRTIIKGNIYPDQEYPGCPYCGARTFVVCDCGKLNCYTSGEREFTCEWCGAKGGIVEYDGRGFSSMSDI